MRGSSQRSRYVPAGIASDAADAGAADGERGAPVGVGRVGPRGLLFRFLGVGSGAKHLPDVSHVLGAVIFQCRIRLGLGLRRAFGEGPAELTAAATAASVRGLAGWLSD